MDKSCHLCDGSFFHTSELKNHIRQVHEERKYLTCKECGKGGFKYLCHLKRHVANNHKNSSIIMNSSYELVNP